jgi:hypothetical protein
MGNRWGGEGWGEEAPEAVVELHIPAPVLGGVQEGPRARGLDRVHHHPAGEAHDHHIRVEGDLLRARPRRSSSQARAVLFTRSPAVLLSLSLRSHCRCLGRSKGLPAVHANRAAAAMEHPRRWWRERGPHLFEVAKGELGVAGGVDEVAADGPGVHHDAVAGDGAAQAVPHEGAEEHPRRHLGPPHPDGPELHALRHVRQERLRGSGGRAVGKSPRALRRRVLEEQPRPWVQGQAVAGYWR